MHVCMHVYIHIIPVTYTHSCNYAHAHVDVGSGQMLICIYDIGLPKDSLRGSSVNVGTLQRISAWPLRRDETHTSRSVTNLK